MFRRQLRPRRGSVAAAPIAAPAADAIRRASHSIIERLEGRQLLSGRLLGITGNLHSPNDPPAPVADPRDERLYEIDFSTPGSLVSTSIVRFPFVPDTDSIGFNPETNLLHRMSGASSYRDNPGGPGDPGTNGIGFRDDHFMQTIDVNSPALTQVGIFNANFEGDWHKGRATGNYGLPAPFPSWILPATRRTDAQTDPAIGDLVGEGEWSSARDITWSETENLFILTASEGLYKLAADGSTSVFAGNSALISGPKGITAFTINGQRRILVSERDGSSLHILDMTTLDPVFDAGVPNPITMLDSGSNPIGGLLSIVEVDGPEGTKRLLGIGRGAADPGEPTLRELVEIEFTDLPNGVATVTSLGAFGPVDGDFYFSDLAWVPDGDTAAAVVDRKVFYNNSAADGNNAGANAQDDAAIAASKQVLIAGAPSAANHSATAQGINGLMIDVDNLPANAEAALDAADFTVKTGPGGDPTGWANGPAPTTIAIRRGAGTGASDRVTLIWSDATSVKDAWIQVTVNANADTGLAAADVFYFGNLAGDATGDRTVSVADVGVLATNFGLSNRTPEQGDSTADGSVTVGDVGVLATNFGTSIGVPTIALREGGGGAAATATQSLASVATPTASSSISRRLRRSKR